MSAQEFGPNLRAGQNLKIAETDGQVRITIVQAVQAIARATVIPMAKKKNPAAVALGRKGGAATKGLTGIRKGFATLDAEQRRVAALKGVEARRKKRQANPETK